MKLIVYGTNACPDCVEAIQKLDEKKADYVYLEFSNNMPNLKRFLKLRDTEVIFDAVKEQGKVGVPCFKLEDGTLTLNLEEVLDKIG
ncbi:glutaredoxin domain-containing protein [Dorea sp. YH-dor226]|uniref:glutaredoxin domain-containing protein n=1 Tax=Dorea sp. YH-dor226 TaxID=3151119 RepID=UPI0032421F8A